MAVIPARGGSKGIPRKNLCEVAGKSLLAWAVDGALAAKSVGRVLVSTEDAEIAEAARQCGAEVPFVRPPELADGAVHAVHVVFHALDWLQEHEDYVPDIVLMLLPTGIFRTAAQIDGAVELFRSRTPQSVVSVCKLDKKRPHLRIIRDGLLQPLEELETANFQRQDVENLYAGNGAIFVSSPEHLRANGSFHAPLTLPYIMSWLNSLDIDEPKDLELARLYARELSPWSAPQ